MELKKIFHKIVGAYLTFVIQLKKSFDPNVCIL
jgi:hypothetical protein